MKMQIVCIFFFLVSSSHGPNKENPGCLQLSVAIEEEEAFPVEVKEGEEGFAISIAGHHVDVLSDWRLGEPMMHASISGKEVTVHVSCAW